MLLATDGLIYVGTVAVGLNTLDPESGNVVSLGKPFPGTRLAGLVQARDGHIYGAGNSGLDPAGRGRVRLFRYVRSGGVSRTWEGFSMRAEMTALSRCICSSRVKTASSTPARTTTRTGRLTSGGDGSKAEVIGNRAGPEEIGAVIV